MIQGDGFFVVKSGGEALYTRAGSFTFDANGSLTTPTGQIVQGWSATDGVVNTAGAPGNIKLPIGISLSPDGHRERHAHRQLLQRGRDRHQQGDPDQGVRRERRRRTR